MSICVMRKVPYRIGLRLLWAFLLLQREGLSFLWVRSPDNKRSSSFVIATENVQERVFEDVNVSRFPLEEEDLAAIGEKCQALVRIFRANHSGGCSNLKIEKGYQSETDT